MTSLFERQRLLKADVSRQARLAKLDVSEVRSTQAEHLRMTNQAILDVSSYGPGSVNPFRTRNLNDAQLIAEDMLRRQGDKRALTGSGPWVPRTKPATRPPRLRRKAKAADKSKTRSATPHLEEIFSLRGPLARSFARARGRGYMGPPSRWLRGTKARQLGVDLLKKGITLLPPEQWSIFDRRSPLYWAVNAASGIGEHSRRRGFLGERLHTEPTNYVVLRAQASSVPRLKISEWPRDSLGQSWPTYPTLNESWEMMLRGGSPHGASHPNTVALSHRVKVKCKQVKPGYACRTISKYVLGVRADLEVPRSCLAYFRYRWGFLILRRRASLPAELVRWLTRVWKESSTALLLSLPVRYSVALRRISSTTRWVVDGWVPGGTAPENGFRLPRSRARRGHRNRPRPKVELWSDALHDETSDRSPSPDKSDDGVRLCLSPPVASPR